MGRGRVGYDAYLRLSSGEWLRIRGGVPGEIFARPWHLLINLGVMLVTVVVLVGFAARYTVRPLTKLAAAARDLAKDLKRPPMPETGPSEVREAAHAFNVMQSTIRAGIEQRERFLAAVSHDLKTPLTRLRLRTELLDDADLADRIRSDVGDMQTLLDSALEYLRGNAVDEPLQPLDIVALIESLLDDAMVQGRVSLKAPESLRFACRPKAIKRALENLIENAMKYGQCAAIEVEPTQDRLIITVSDEGPGLPDDELDRVFEPFYRVESSRSRETGGTGLGLAIVRQIVESHGGQITLENCKPSGLRATLTFPVVV
jgi:signal transduction histidine kinase